MPRKKKYATGAERQAAYRVRQARSKRNSEALRFRPKHLQIRRPVLSWHGGKFLLRQWIIDQMPAHSTYVEPYGGAASVLLAKVPVWHEVYNDMNGDVVNFFDVLRSEPDRLIREIQLTPHSRAEHRRAWEPVQEPVERARRFYVRIWQSFGSGTASTAAAAGWKYDKVQTRGKAAPSTNGQWNDLSTLWLVVERLKGVQIEQDDALKVIQRYDSDSALFYVDPPYVLSTRSDSWAGKAYSHEADDEHHHQLAALLRSVEGYVIVSGYESDLYNELFSGWHKVTKQGRDVLAQSQTEVLWLSPRTADAQLPLFNAAQ